MRRQLIHLRIDFQGGAMKKVAIGIAAIITLIGTAAATSAQSAEPQSTDDSARRVQALEAKNAALAKENAALREQIKLSKRRVSQLKNSKQKAAIQQKFTTASSALSHNHPNTALYDEASSPMAPRPSTSSWTGLYGGLNIGAGLGNASDSFTMTAAGGILFPLGSDSNHVAGVIGGGQAGYNWQVGQYVLGIETDIQGTGQSGNAITACSVSVCGTGGTITNTEKLTWFGTARGKVGVVIGNWLTYVTAGAAYGRVESNWTSTYPGIALTVPISNSTMRTGWTLGAGLEAPLTGNWTWKVEYLYIDLGTATFVTGSLPPAFFAAGTTFTESMHFTDNILRAGVNLRF
jgi:outer membrane immunogenic protein